MAKFYLIKVHKSPEETLRTAVKIEPALQGYEHLVCQRLHTNYTYITKAKVHSLADRRKKAA